MNDAAPEWPPPGIDPDIPSTARVYDAALGGRNNFKADRDAVAVFERLIPQVREATLLNRKALIRGVQYLVRHAGIDQIIDIGCGLPTEQNTHQAAQEINPDTRVVYVDNDPMVLSHGRALLDDNRTTTVVTADLRDPAGILANPEVRGHLDFDRPIAIVIVGMIMQIAEDEDPDAIIATLMEPLASGSHLFLTAWPDTGDPAQRGLSQGCLRDARQRLDPTDQASRAAFPGHADGASGIRVRLALVSGGARPTRCPISTDFEPYERTQMAGIAVKP